MTDKRVVDEIITKFLFNTCRLAPRLSEPSLQAALSYASIANIHPRNDEDVEIIPVKTGSIAEFYIEPMLKHVGDIDIMYHYSDELAIPEGHPSPTQLPAEFHNRVRILQIIDSHLPGYVYLLSSYFVKKITESSPYFRGYRPCGSPWPTDIIADLEISRPARLQDKRHHLSVDLVFCVRCLSWPSQAADWPTRHRNYGWPDSATVDRVLSNGCDVVQIAHRQCRQDEWMRKYQWRLSFSRAEIVLINSWMPVQQIVYHLLRVIMKTEKCTESADNSGVSTLSNYHIKTLMLWACEMKPLSWWTDDLSLVRICVELLHTLAVWLTEARCPHYFINNSNLVDKSYVLGITACRLLLIDDNYLSSWFVTSYIRQSVQICPESVSWLFDDVSTTWKLDNAVSAVVDWRLNTTTEVLYHDLYSAMYIIVFCVNAFSVSARLCIFWMSELLKADARLFIYFIAVVYLHVVQKIRSGGLTKNLLRALKVTLSSNYYNKRTFSLLTEVVILGSKCQAQAVNTVNCNRSKLIRLLHQSAVELLTTFRHFEARDFGSLAAIVTTDFEALYVYNYVLTRYGEYQQCLDLSIQNVHTLLNAERLVSILAFPEFLQFLDADIVSLTALTLIVSPECRDNARHSSISQLTLSLYLMTQCQLKLGHSLTSLAETIDYIEVAQRRHKVHFTLNQLILKFIERKLVEYIATGNSLSCGRAVTQVTDDT